MFTRRGVEDTRLEAKDTKIIRGQGQGQPFRGQTLSRPRTGMLEAKAKVQGHRRKCSPKKKRFSKKFFKLSQKQGLQKIFFQSKKVSKKFFSRDFHLRKTKKVYANFLRGFRRFPTKFQPFKK